MRKVENSELSLVRRYFRGARDEIEKPFGEGALIVKNNVIIGRGKKSLEKCAEEVAIEDAFNKNKGLAGSTIYLARVNGDKSIIPMGKPSCKLCSELALKKGISYWILFHEDGFYLYDSEEYYEISLGLRK